MLRFIVFGRSGHSGVPASGIKVEGYPKRYMVVVPIP